ncbi:hypothetical protein A3Q56_07971 [Intoshia linei]|uniref:Uncharacterized protein n=1 Tax=Intoshia linei TaxID=1819745 RepID=A0A177AR78_9BILA|nr:hypothetical protein A3Q56_07971 [Intoshia linei]
MRVNILYTLKLQEVKEVMKMINDTIQDTVTRVQKNIADIDDIKSVEKQDNKMNISKTIKVEK